MKVLLLGGNGFLGPHVVNELQGDYELRITDIVPIESKHETMQVDISDPDQVLSDRLSDQLPDELPSCSRLVQHDIGRACQDHQEGEEEQ